MDIAAAIRNQPHIIACVIDRLLTYTNGCKTRNALHAIELLDVCVLNAGYAFPLQMASKENLNALVRRFPKQAPVHRHPVTCRPRSTTQCAASLPPSTSGAAFSARLAGRLRRLPRTCATFAEWPSSCSQRVRPEALLCVGYRLAAPSPTSCSSDCAAPEVTLSGPAAELRTVEELAQQHRERQEARLQELLRRGTPADLAKANELMRVISGYESTDRAVVAEQFRSEVQAAQASVEALAKQLDNCRCRSDLSSVPHLAVRPAFSRR